MPTLYKYLPAPGAISLLARRELWFRCPLQFEPWDCRPDLLENLDVVETRRAIRGEIEGFLCDSATLSVSYQPVSLRLTAMRMRGEPWTAEDVERTFGDVVENAFKDLNEYRDRIRKEQERVLQDVRVLCLCENMASVEMWKRYADKGRGVCIGFRSVPKLDNSLGAARPVEYVDKWPVIATPLEWARAFLGIEQIPFGKQAGDALYVKRREFSHEQEWRVVTKPRPATRADSDGVYRVTIDPLEVVEVIFGPSLSTREESKLRAASQAFCPHAAVRTFGTELTESIS